MCHKLKFNFQNPENRKAFEEVIFDHDQYVAAVTDDDQVFQEFGILEDTVVAFKKVAFCIYQWGFVWFYFWFSYLITNKVSVMLFLFYIVVFYIFCD